ncbi:hypothetical protein [Streptomyces werraensis]|uniref:hypothetical protein n=1 Tax=Streptomyces werraensis TaxID=68284 RepID=UPI001CE3A373
MTTHVDEQVQARIAAAKAKRELQAEQRAELAANRQAGLTARKKAKGKRLYCATCARLQWRGTYYRCPLGCGVAVCRKNPHCGNTHLRQCDNRPEAS